MNFGSKDGPLFWDFGIQIGNITILDQKLRQSRFSQNLSIFAPEVTQVSQKGLQHFGDERWRLEARSQDLPNHSTVQPGPNLSKMAKSLQLLRIDEEFQLLVF